MPFDGRYYTGAAPISPALHHPHAPAVGDLCGQSLRAGYFFAQHQATLIGSQTWPQRNRRFSLIPTLNSASFVRVAEWCAVHLATHHSRVIGDLIVGVGQPMDPLEIKLRVVLVGTATVTGSTTTVVAQPETEETGPAFSGYQVLRAYASTSALALPAEDVRIYLEASAAYRSAATAAHVVPMLAHAWRVSV